MGRSGPCTELGGEQGDSWESLHGQGRAGHSLWPLVQLSRENRPGEKQLVFVGEAKPPLTCS